MYNAKSTGVHVDDLYTIGEDTGFNVSVSWNRQQNDGCFDVVYTKARQVSSKYHFKQPGYSLWNWKSYGNNPMIGVVNQLFIPSLRDKLSTTLPKFMIPSSVVVLDSLPLTSNGKINRRALPTPISYHSEDDKNFVAPKTDHEKTLTNIFSEVLGIEKISIHGNFFDLGGHSLSATKVMSRIRVALGQEVPLKMLFEAPTVSSLSERLKNYHGITSSVHSIIPVMKQLTERNQLPLSFAQERLWFMNELIPNSHFYNMPLSLLISGDLNVDALKQSILDVIWRHETLRTIFVLSGSEPVQVIKSTAFFSLSFIDHNEDCCDLDMAKLVVVEEFRKPFDLAEGPLIRVKLLPLQSGEYVLCIVLHHIISDGWSITVLQKELASLYESNTQGTPSSLPKLVIQYADFAVWQREWLQGEILEKQLQYWKQQLDGIIPLNLPIDFVRPSVLSYNAKIEVLHLDPSFTQRLKELSKMESSTLFMTLLTAFEVLLMKYTGQEDIAVGSPIANRNRKEIEGLIGFFVNTQVIRVQMDHEITFSELLGRVKDVTLGAYSHQDIPFEKIVAELQPERDINRNPVVQVMFALQDATIDDFKLGEISVKPVDTGEITTRFDLEVHFWKHDDGLKADFIYSTDLFSSDTIFRMISDLQKILNAAVDNPYQAIGTLQLVDHPERENLLVTMNMTGTDYPRDQSIVDIFEQQVRNTPDAIGVIHNDEQLTYRELHLMSNKLASYLITFGVNLESSVAICMERSTLMIVALLAVLKAGGAYVPLDSQYPTDRLRFILDDTKSDIVICQKSTFLTIPAGDYNIISLDENIASIMELSEELVCRRPSSSNLAYTIYTSGSTGIPKGVLVEHRSVVRLVKNTEYISIQSNDKIAHIASTSFDAATFEVWGALLNGATLVCISHSDVIDLAALSRNMINQSVTIIFLTTALFNRVVEDAPSVFNRVKHVLFGGEAADNRFIQKFLDISNRPRLLHVYGPTENTTFSTWYEVNQISNNIPIGKPLSNGRVYILDNHFNPVPIGFVGELCLAGDGLARGYLNQPELTAQKFIANPNLECNGEIIYRTGDLARYRSDGNIEFVGRMDHQVKIRGYRIELGEVENTLLQQDSIKECAVVARDDPSGEKQLVAYVVVDSNSTSGMDTQQVNEWGTVFDQHVYDDMDEDLAEPSFNITGWKCTLTGEDIPADEMREWLNDTLAGIRQLGGDDILEIGCGTGMLLFEIAPHCDHYVGTDVSTAALSYVNKYLDTYSLRDKVRLEKRSGDQLDDMEKGGFDTVICNSVAQYFPNIDYLKTVVVKAVKLLRPGGHIFLGDIRSLVLLEHFHSAMELHKAHNDLTVAELEQRIADSMLSEKELLVDPAFFFALKEEIPEISKVNILTKTGSSINELTQYRYQVVIQVGTSDESEVIEDWVDYQESCLTVDDIKNNLLQGDVEYYAIENVPNLRLSNEIALVKLLKSQHAQELIASSIRKLLADVPLTGVAVNELFDIGQHSGYDVNVSWNCHENDGCYDVIYTKHTLSNVRQHRFKEPSFSRWNWKSYGNNPMNEVVNQQLSPYLRDYLHSVLPKFMVPSTIIILDSLPLMPNGKINRRALPAITSRVDDDKNFVSARTTLEQTLCDIFTEVLGLKRVSILENFFDLGGHSLTATKVISRIRIALNQDVPLKYLFEAPTVASLGEKLESNLNALNGTSLIPTLKKVTNRDNLPLSFAQERLWFLNELIPNSSFYNMPVVLNFTDKLNVDALKESIVDIVKRHEALRTTFTLSDNGPVQVINAATNVAPSFIEYSDVTYEPELVNSMIVHESEKPFDIAEGPLIRAKLIRVKPDVHVLIIVLHHIISDGWSITVLQKELAALYQSNSLGLSSPLPDLTIQYADFTVWQREWLQGETLHAQLKYWKEQLKDISPLALPTDKIRPAISSHRGRLHRIYIPESLTKKLRVVSQQHTTTLFMTLFAAFGVLLNKYTEQEDLVVGSPIANRNVKEIEALIGFFVNTLVLRLQVDSESTFCEILNQAKSVTLDASTYQDVPFEKIVAELQPERDLSLNPLVQVVFALHELSITDFDAKDFNIDGHGDQQTTSRLDLEVHIHPHGNSLRADVIYCTDLFVPSTIEHMFEGFIHILECIAIDPQQVLFGGEAVDHRFVQKFLDMSNRPRLLHVYGPTENTTFSTWYEVNQISNNVPIGKPISNSKVYVLDRQFNPVPTGFVGELCVAGDGLARGYLNQSELTAQKFIVNPNPECGGEIMYRTGDLARFRSDGNLVFVGRRDDQVKIRGYRIELDEIRNALLKHEGVKECVVVVNSEADIKRIVAYIIKDMVELEVTEDSLKAHLANSLPKYMLPYAILMVDNIPLLPSGKLDIRSLSTLACLPLAQEISYVEPQTPLEIGIANIMADVLSLERVGLNDNFFDLGGHSLLSIQLISKVRKLLGVSISLHMLFEAPTVFMLAKNASLRNHENNSESIDSPVVMLREGGDEIPIVLIHAIGGGLSCYQPLLSCLKHDGPIYGIYASDFLGLLRRKSFYNVEDMAQYYVESLMELSGRRKFIVGGWSYGGNIAFSIAVALQKIAVDVPSVFLFDSYPLFGIECYEKYSMPLATMIIKLMNQMHESTEIPGQEFHMIRDLFGLSNNFSRDDEVTLELLTSALNRISHMRQYQPDKYTGTVCQFRCLLDKFDYVEDTSSLQDKWSTLFEGKYITKSVKGSHATMLQSPYIENIATELEMFIESL
ncbi:hypothetical protein K7432_010368 [Basidiobolus ranarum]|uniref:Carrier domain-containing protein n=1 Tax=Basidiobolus ranarum TaxID=34480 RepID=A0ABR2WNY1_9FUNG